MNNKAQFGFVTVMIVLLLLFITLVAVMPALKSATTPILTNPNASSGVKLSAILWPFGVFLGFIAVALYLLKGNT